MNEESLSALLDGECSPAELEGLLQRLSREPALRQRFARMAQALELRRGIQPPAVPADFADRVMAGIDAAASRPVAGTPGPKAPAGVSDETLSALLDGECTPAELDLLLQRMKDDPGLGQRFARMAMNQELRRGLRVPAVPADFADRVMAALPERPDAPAKGPKTGTNVVSLPRRASWQPLAGLAAAAGLGAVAVLAMKPAPEPVAPVAVPVAEAAPAEVEFVELSDANARQLRNYVMAYSQSRAQQGLGGTLGYARYAAYTRDAAEEAP